MRRFCCYALLAVVGAAYAQEVELPHVFQAGTPARAADVNANFAALADAVNDHGTALATLLGAGEPQERGTLSMEALPYTDTAMPIYGIEWNGTMTVGGGGGAGVASFGGVKVFKPFDLSSPQLLIDFGTGKHFPSATIVVSSGGSAVATFVLESVYMRGLGAANVNGVPFETVELAFEVIKLSVADSGSGDSTSSCFDLDLNSIC